MPVRKSYDDLINRAINEPKFRKQLLASPEETIRTEGYEVPKDQLEKLMTIDPKTADDLVRNLEASVQLDRTAV